MKKIMLVLLAMVMLFGMPHFIQAQSAKDAVRALQKLQARVEVGVIYRDYLPALGDAKFEVNLFLKSPEAKNKIELADAISTAMEYYETAGEIWKSSIQKPAIGVKVAWAKAHVELEKAVSLLSK